MLSFLPVLLLLHILASGQSVFTQITSGDVAQDKGTFSRAVWGDFNNDGFLDLFVGGFSGVNLFYLNNGNGTFAKRTQGAPVEDINFHSGAAAGDYDNDGNLDLFSAAGVLAPSTKRATLYRNDGAAGFTPVTNAAPGNLPGNFDACAWADYDNDGFLDLVVTDGGSLRTLLFHNLGDGTFARVTAGPVVTDPSSGIGVLWADFDGDRQIDLLVINTATGGRNFLYRNTGGGAFTRVQTNAIGSDTWPAGCAAGAWGDYDNDGLPDLFVAGQSVTNRLYHNDGNGVFTQITSGPMLVPPPGQGPSGCAWGDYDNDGYLDLFVNNYEPPNGLFHNNKDGTFTQILDEAPVNAQHSLGLSWVDYDNDGSLDLFITRSLFDGTSLTSNLLYHNGGSKNGWLELKLRGTVANRSGIGAKVRVKATIGGKTFWQMREINDGGGWNVQPLMAHFGLGDAPKVDTLRIEWPSGTVQELHDVLPKQILTMTEPAQLIATRSNDEVQVSLKGGRNLQYQLDSSPNLTVWTSFGTLNITNVNGLAEMINVPSASGVQFYRAILR